MTTTQPSKTHISEAVHRYLTARASQVAASTLVGERYTSDRLLTYLSRDILTRTLTVDHVQGFLHGENGRARKVSLATVNKEKAHLSIFLRWCARRRLLDPELDVEDLLKARRVPKVDRLRVPADQFGLLLQGAGHPRDRMFVALGLYTFARMGEITGLRVRDVHLAEGLLQMVVPKTGDYDDMPICSELDVELRRWLRSYESEAGTLDPAWFLVPTKTAPLNRFAGPNDRHPVRVSEGQLIPSSPMTRASTIVRRTVATLGVDPPKGEGCHILRRSGARALFDELIADASYDGALETVSSMLHHTSVTTTELYLGLKMSRKKRDDRLKGQAMFRTLAGAGALTSVRTISAAGEDHGGWRERLSSS